VSAVGRTRPVASRLQFSERGDRGVDRALQAEHDRHHGRYRKAKPDVVLEVAFNSIQPSARRATGLALRFPKIKGVRRDKNVDSIDTL
jgi:ATP-dependent DNA ligase